MTAGQLRQMNSKDKEEYVKFITEEDYQIAEYIKATQDKLAKARSELIETQSDLQDTQTDWEANMKQINENIIKAAEKNGISKREF